MNQQSLQWTIFSVLSKLHSSFHLKLLETIHILFYRPSFCKPKECLLWLDIICYPLIVDISLSLFSTIIHRFSTVERGRNRSASFSLFFYAFSSIMTKMLGLFVVIIKCRTSMNIFKHIYIYIRVCVCVCVCVCVYACVCVCVCVCVPQQKQLFLWSNVRISCPITNIFYEIEITFFLN